MSATRTYVHVTPHELYILCSRGFKLANYEYDSSDRGVLIVLKSGYFEDDIALMEYCDE